MGLRVAILLVAILLIAAITLLSSMTDAGRQAFTLNLAYAAGIARRP